MNALLGLYQGLYGNLISKESSFTQGYPLRRLEPILSEAEYEAIGEAIRKSANAHYETAIAETIRRAREEAKREDSRFFVSETGIVRIAADPKSELPDKLEDTLKKYRF